MAGLRTDRKLVFMAVTFAAIACMIMLCGCSQAPPAPGNTSASPSLAPANLPALMPLPAPATTGCTSACGHVFLNGSAVPGAWVEAVSIDGTYRAANITNGSGAYCLLIPPGQEFNATATYQGMKRTIWPVFSNYVYDLNLTTKPGSYITGTGHCVGGPAGFNPALYNFSGTRIIAERGIGYPAITAQAGSDGRYVLELEPGVLYHVRGAVSPPTWLYFHNTNRGGLSVDVMLDANETALIDYTVVLPAM